MMREGLPTHQHFSFSKPPACTINSVLCTRPMTFLLVAGGTGTWGKHGHSITGISGLALALVLALTLALALALALLWTRLSIAVTSQHLQSKFVRIALEFDNISLREIEFSAFVYLRLVTIGK